MAIDSFESKAFNVETFDASEKMSNLNKGFDSKITQVDGVFKNPNLSVNNGYFYEWLGVENQEIREVKIESVSNNIKRMYNGTTLSNGEKSLGLKDIASWEGDNKNKSVIRGKAGYAAEVISTTKENIKNEAKGIVTYRADDLPEEYKKNDQYVDKVRKYPDGKIEKIQVKFVGDDGKSCYEKLKQKKYDKYFTDGEVDTIEIPKDYYKGAKKAAELDRKNLENQLKHAKENGKTELQDKIQSKIDKVNKIDSMLEKSNTTSTEAIRAVKHPKAYAAEQIAKSSARDGVTQAKEAIIVTGAISTVDNMSQYMDGNITAEEAVKNIASETGTAGAAAFGVEFVSSSAAALMQNSSNGLIRKVGEASRGNAAAYAVSYGVEVHGAVIDYAKGTIDNKEFADELGRGAAKVAGGAVGSTVGKVAGPIGSYYGAQIGSEVGEISYEATKTVVKAGIEYASGEATTEEVTAEVENAIEEAADKSVETVNNYKDSAVELVSKTVKYAVTTEAYVTAVEKYGDTIDKGAEQIEKLESKAKEYADQVVEKAGDFGQDAVKDVKAAINNFNVKNAIPFNV